MTSLHDGDGERAALRAATELHTAQESERFEAAAALVESETEQSELRVLIAAREHLDMDVSYCSHLTATEQVVQRVYGDGRSFGLQSGTTIPLGDTYDQRVVDDRLPNLITDAHRRAGRRASPDARRLCRCPREVQQRASVRHAVLRKPRPRAVAA